MTLLTVVLQIYYAREMQMKFNMSKELHWRFSENLWNLSNIDNYRSIISPKLIFPTKEADSNKISVQEAQIIYISLLNQTNYYYSLEAPTKHLYVRDGKIPRIGNIDLSLYTLMLEKDIKSGVEKGKFILEKNVEFKSGQPDYKKFMNDIEKLLVEGIDGAWIHLLNDANSGDINHLFRKFIASFTHLHQHKVIDLEDLNSNISIDFFVNIQDKKCALLKRFEVDKYKKNSQVYVNNFFDISYEVINEKINIKESNGWTVF